MKRILLILCSTFFTLGSFAQTTFTLDSTVLTQRLVKDSLDIPWEILWGPDDHIWCTERFGRVSRINPNTGQQNVLLDLSSDVYQQSEAGMLGMVLHPDFTNNPQAFIAYTYLAGSNIRERLVRFNYTGTALVPADTLLENIQGNTTHIGCRLIILQDNTLLMSTGDAQAQSLPQNKNSIVGKILRMNLDGSIPADNPDPTSYVWSFGHRNAQGLWLAPNGKVYSSEHGPTTDDELNIIEKDKNYGWPDVNGFCNTPPEIAFCNANNVEEPLAAWTPTIAPSDIIWYSHPAIPEFKDKLLMTVLKDKSLISFEFNAAGDAVVAENKFFKDDFGRLRDICISPSGKIYLATNGNSWSNNSPFTHSIIELSNKAYVPNNIKDKKKEKSEVSISPNPITPGQQLSVALPWHHGEATFCLFDISGRVILKKEVTNAKKILIDVLPGIYIWHLNLEKGVSAQGKLRVR